MEGEECFYKVLVVSVAVGAALQGPDFVVEAFERAGRERVVVPAQQTSAVRAEGLGQRLGHPAEIPLPTELRQTQ